VGRPPLVRGPTPSSASVSRMTAQPDQGFGADKVPQELSGELLIQHARPLLVADTQPYLPNIHFSNHSRFRLIRSR